MSLIGPSPPIYAYGTCLMNSMYKIQISVHILMLNLKVIQYDI